MQGNPLFDPHLIQQWRRKRMAGGRSITASCMLYRNGDDCLNVASYTVFVPFIIWANITEMFHQHEFETAFKQEGYAG